MSLLPGYLINPSHFFISERCLNSVHLIRAMVYLMISVFLWAQGYKTAIYSNVNTLQSPIFPMRFHFSMHMDAHSVSPVGPRCTGGSLSLPYFSWSKPCIMVLLLCPRLEAVVVINSGLSVVLLQPITNPHLHLGSVVMHCFTLLINNPHCI